MNKNALNNAIVVALASTLITACAHTQQTEPQNQAAQNTPEAAAPIAQTPAPAPAPVPVQIPEPMPVTNQLSQLECGSEDMMDHDHYLNNEGKKAEEMKIRVTGYGAPPKAFYPDPQRRLMAMRAAKIDAYRSMAERVAGLQIWGGTTIGDMVVEKDRFRVYLDTHLTGARVITESAQEDGTFETVVELKVDQSFLDKTLPKKRFKLECKEKPAEPINMDKMKSADSRTPGGLQNANFYFQEE